MSLSNTKSREDLTQQILGSHFTRHRAERIKSFTEFKGQQVGAGIDIRGGFKKQAAARNRIRRQLHGRALSFGKEVVAATRTFPRL